jgi:hypothetical protein
MAFPTAVNSQITDSITQTNVSVVGNAPAMAMGALYQSMGQAAALAAQNAVTAQQQSQTISAAATTLAVTTLLGDDAAVDGGK